MRLTLRTLLAYLDDMLEPEDTKIIGQKIQESPMAQLLVSRIREVMRRRRLKAPDVFGPEMGIDPNIVSQYLDNTLAPEQYADVERVLLASDDMLAEAASCHEILTVDPPMVALAMRERLYALGPVDSDSQLVVPDGLPRTGSRRTPQSIPIRSGLTTAANGSLNSASAQPDRATTVPDYLKRSPWFRRVLPSAIVGLLGIISAALLAPEFLVRVRQANNEIKRKGDREKVTDAGVADKTESLDQVKADPILIASDPNLPARTSATATADALKTPRGIDPPPPKDVDEDAVVPGPGLSQPGQSGNRRPEMADVVPPPSAPVKQEPTQASPVDAKPFPIPPEVKDVSISYGSSEGALLRLDLKRFQWLMVPHRSEIHSGDIVASIEPFESLIDFDKGEIRTTLIGETVARLLDPAAVGVSGFQIDRGRIVIQSKSQAENSSAEIGLAIGDDVWKLELASRETLCGVEVISRQPYQFQKPPQEPRYQATLYVLKGSAKWTNRRGKTVEIGPQLAMKIGPEADAQMRPSPVSIAVSPDWCDSVKRKAMSSRKHQYQVQFEKTFELDQSVDENMLNLMRNSKSPKIAELATQCMSAIGDYAGLVEALAECPHEEARFAAREGLRTWLPASPEHGMQLKEELDLHYPPAESEAIYQMLWGFSRDDVVNSKVNSWRFVDWMRSPKTEIRELADYWVERLTDKKTEYRAQGGTAAQRESHIRRLEEQIERNNGLIKGP